MQNRQSPTTSFEYVPIRMPSNFPVVCHGAHYATDKPLSSMHCHDILEIGYCHEGTGVFVIGDKVFSYHSDDMVVINNLESHFAQPQRNFKGFWTWIYVDPVKLLMPHFPLSPFLEIRSMCGKTFQNLFPAKKEPGIRHLILDLIQEMNHPQKGYKDAVTSLIYTLMVKLHRLPGLSVSPEPVAKMSVLRRLRPGLDRIQSHYSEKLSMEEIARICGMGISNFRRLFTLTFGKSPQRFLAEYRVAMAMTDLRNSGKKVIQIAYESGFPTLSSFNRTFRSVAGTTPRNARKQN